MFAKQYSVVLSGDAEIDIMEGYLWYEEQESGLGEKFLNEIDQAFVKIVNHPTFFHFEKKGLRCYVLKQFPYKVLYLLDDELIKIMSVFHHSRNPTDWQMRN